MIAPSAVRELLGREHRDSNAAKRRDPEWVDEKLAALGATFVTPPYRHQKVCVLLGAARRKYLYFLDMGTGKSKIALDLFSLAKRDEPTGRALVLVPNVANVEGWRDEARIHAPDLVFEGLDFSGRESRIEAIEAGSDVLATTYAGWASLVCRKEKVGRARKPKLVPDPSNRLEGLFDFVVFDESSFLKNHESLAFRLAKRLAKRARYVMLLTGTPLDKSPEDLWTQFYLVDGGRTLGETLGLYRAAYFHEKKNYWGGFEYSFDRRRTKALARAVRGASIRYSEDECLDLPETVGGLIYGRFARRYAIYGKEAGELAREAWEAIRKAEGAVDVIQSKYAALRMIESGYLAFKSEDGTRHTHVFDENPKLDELIEYLAGVPEGDKTIVAHHYRTSGELIAKRLNEIGTRYVRLVGGQRPAESKAAVRAFKDDPEVRVLVGSRSAAFGHNFQVANRILFFESPDSTIDRRQYEKRIRRPGQTKTTFVVDFVVKGGIGDRILDSLVAGKRLFDELIERGRSGKQERDRALARVERRADEDWKAVAERELGQLIESGEPFTTDDLWARLDGRVATEERRALGALIMRASRAGRIEKTQMKESKMPDCHARPKQEWVGVRRR